jgi:4-amino-4-deoxychorismate lyase
VLAQLELRGQAVQQGLMLDASGCVAQGTTSNVFIVVGGELVTPNLARCGIKGVMRRVVLDASRTLRTRAVERDILPAELMRADEVFMTNALFGIWPVTELDGRRLAVGATTQRLMAHLGYGDA